jgi:hypothetical protein
MRKIESLAGENEDLLVAQALKNFKASVDAWSETAMSRPRSVKTVRSTWRLAAGWALGCVLAAGSLSGGLYERHHGQELARIAAAQKAQAQKAASAQPAATSAIAEDQDLLATVDSDISRGVPAAMEPLAQLMDDDGTK